ncbi:MAG: hypothetical protein A3G18_10720 [Rhodospirillales bacterium RIFCSPLOWO2_12_FULL_58_28]|nr:MAG: hypothetical protein A3H92_11075 [Rhodospirillales bacterium RIFCSPLOWO2_02_FULL_58_16]OHC77892.1 MAG: hypothetical protein A3G18_10720 [Rhodospirillales bacterium RIFCSPLOWO2_12_FULL_58_28]
MKVSGHRLSTKATVRAARTFTRRTLLKGAVAAGAIAGVGPWIVRDAFSSSGELKIMMWSDFLPDSVSGAFTKATGINIKQTLYGSDEELFHRIKAFKGHGFDLISPLSRRMGYWRTHGLLQPWDMEKVPVDRIDLRMFDMALSAGMWGGKVHLLPFVWGTEGLAWRTDKWSRDAKDLTYGDLWTPEMKGKIMGSPIPMLLALGLYLDRVDKVPSNRMLDCYKDEDSMRRIWDEIIGFAVKRKSWVKMFWEDAESQINGFKNNGVVLGQTWNGPPTRLAGKGDPIAFMAPMEGALGWLAGLSIPVGAGNIDQAYEFLKFQYSPRNGARLADMTGYSSCAAGAATFQGDKKKKKKAVEAYPGSAMEKLWWWPVEEPWHTAAHAEYGDRFVNA